MSLSMTEYGAERLVWVLRKNGSWWPGRILTPNELSQCNYSCDYKNKNGGIPIKLLGKEDDSGCVDWFNLERSKRIKAFRCGEFDDCIAKAESSQARCLKSPKYVCRADAILHALQLEKQEVITKPKRPGEDFQKAVCRAKRSRCVYLPNKSSNSSSAISDHQSSILQPHVVMSNCPVQSGSTGRSTSSTSRGYKSFAANFPNREKEESLKEASGQNENGNLHAYEEQGGSKNKTDRSVQSYSSDLLKDPTAGFVKVHKWKAQGKMKVQISTKPPVVVSSRKHVQEDLLSGSSSKVLGPLDNGSPNSWEKMLVDVEVAVQTSYRKEHVPLVSLMSRLNGRAIIGHPIEIEVSEVNSSETKSPLSDDLAGSMKFQLGRSISRRRTPVRYLPVPPPPHKPDDQASEKTGHSSLKRKENVSSPGQEQLLKPLKKRELPSQYRVNRSKNRTAQATCVPVALVFSKLYEGVGRLGCNLEK